MPIKFPCLHCQKSLSARSRKVGHKVKCPNCDKTLTVPTLEEGAAMLDLRNRARSQSSAEDDPYSEFIVYDDEGEFDFETGNVTRPGGDQGNEEFPVRIDPTKVAVPRLVLYMQGILLGIVGLGAFAIGVFVSDTGPTDDPGSTKPATIIGKLTYLNVDNQAQPDGGAIVLALPLDKRPDEKLAASGLRPDEPPPGDSHEGVLAIQQMGGSYGRADGRGQFQLQVPRSGRYFLLLMSGNTQRKEGELPDGQDIAQIGRYFLLPGDLIGDNKYRWTEEMVRGREQLTFSFERSRE